MRSMLVLACAAYAMGWVFTGSVVSAQAQDQVQDQVQVQEQAYGKNLPQQQNLNAQIDMNGFVEMTAQAQKLRETRRIDVDTFIRMSKEPGTIILDTRSKANYDRKHIKGALHLNFSDFTADKLASIIPSKDTRILIYCNNNFINNSAEFATKAPPLALNIPTFINLYGYGYRNIYELGPAVDEYNTRLEFGGTEGVGP